MLYSQSHLEIIDGLLLGDGSMRKVKGVGRRSASYSQGCKYKTVLESVQNELSILKFGPIYLNEVKEHYSNGKFLPSAKIWTTESHSYAQLLPIWERWYPNGLKRIPGNIQLTGEMCYWWFIGDGSLGNSISLATNGFSDECRLILQREFSRLGLYSTITKSGSMLIKPYSIPDFYRLIGPCRHPEYSYKWDWSPPKWSFTRNGRHGKLQVKR